MLSIIISFHRWVEVSKLSVMYLIGSFKCRSSQRNPWRPTVATTMDCTSPDTIYPAGNKIKPVQVEELSSPVPHSLCHTHASRSIVIAGWTITSTKLPISSSSEGDELSAQLGIPVPEMTFGNNSINIVGPNGWQCEFNTQEALDAVDKTGSKGMKVSYSEQWNRTRHRPH